MKFTKMHGIGNDYIYVNCFEETVENPEEVSRLVSKRHYGIGSDGLVLICPSNIADCRMQIYNEDGSEAMMCGNGIRCVGKYVYDHGIVDKLRIRVDTRDGIKVLDMKEKDGRVYEVTVDMGIPRLTGVLEEPITAVSRDLAFTGVSTGNPHAVFLVEDVDAVDLAHIGPCLENHTRFQPDRVNVEFVQVIDRGHIRMRVWERGSGITLACGTGATASVYAGIQLGLLDDCVEVELSGGCLAIHLDKETGHMFMTGPAVEVFHGEIDLKMLAGEEIH
ncbi:MAG: diaminopimelate epimerase [Clostridiales bacterium]|nr:diaminopimelate epimerase [Clostridiales bacterium]